MYKNKTFLITGGTGSFGRTILKHLLNHECKEVRIFSRDEAKQDLMRSEYINDSRVKFYIGDVRDYDSISNALINVDFVFHAAALKQVPSCEFFPMQAVMTNVLGSDNVLKASVANNVSKVVCLSTDKAVYPINAMGISKAMMEKVAQSYARKNTNTIVICVRYGNVMYSRGSVIPRFVEQIKSGDPITITNGDMTRFLMALSEAVNLVDFAFNKGRQGDIFIKKSPACSVNDLAKAIMDIFKTEVEIKVIGTRHGEKLYETLASVEELIYAEEFDDYYRVSMDDRDLNYDKYIRKGSKNSLYKEDYHSHNTEQLDVNQVKDLLLSLDELNTELHMWNQNKN